MSSFKVEFKISGSAVGFSDDKLNKRNIKHHLKQFFDYRSEHAKNSLGSCCSRIDDIRVDVAGIPSYLER